MAAVSKMRRGPIRPPRYTVNGPINIRPTSKAVLIHALSSNPNPWRPLKSGKPREIIRLVSVTTPAPVTTPRIPSSGLAEISAGIAAAAVRAISTADGRTVMLESAICSSSPSRAHSCDHGYSGTQFHRESGILQRNLDRNTLHDFCEVASGVVGRQQSELGSAGWCYLDHFAANELPGIFVDAKFSR